MIENEDLIEQLNRSTIVSNAVIKKVIEIIGQEKWQELEDSYSDIFCTSGELISVVRNEDISSKDQLTYLSNNKELILESCQQMTYSEKLIVMKAIQDGKAILWQNNYDKYDTSWHECPFPITPNMDVNFCAYNYKVKSEV